MTDFKVSYTRRDAWVMETLELKFVGFLSGLLFGLIRRGNFRQSENAIELSSLLTLISG